MNRILKYTLSFLESEKGETSSRRLAGLFLAFSGGFSKLALIAYGAKIKIATQFTLYEKLDNTADSLIIVGACLLGSTTVDKLTRFIKK